MKKPQPKRPAVPAAKPAAPSKRVDTKPQARPTPPRLRLVSSDDDFALALHEAHVRASRESRLNVPTPAEQIKIRQRLALRGITAGPIVPLDLD